MAVAKQIKETMNSKGASVIRKMFEEGAVLKAKYGADKVFDFSIGNPDLEPPKEVLEAIQEVATDTTKGSHGYMPNAGYTEVRKAMADKTNWEQYGDLVPEEKKVTGEQVVMAVGAAGALNALFKAIINSGDEVLVPVPFFAEYGHYCRNHGGTLVPVQSRPDLSIDPVAFEKALTEKTAAVLICSPNNPSGKIYSEENIGELVAVLEKHGKKTGRKPYLICDEPYRAITYKGKKVASVFPVYNEAVIVSSFAKNLSLPGERVGYIAVNPLCPDWAELVAACIFCTRVLGYVNSPAFFQKVVAKSWKAKVDYSAYTGRMEQISSVVKAAGLEFVEPEGAFYLFVKAPLRSGESVADDFAFTDHLKKYNILCAPGTGFGCPGYFRMAYCVSESTILNCGTSLKDAVQSYK